MSTMQRWNPARDFARLQDEVNRLFDEQPRAHPEYRVVRLDPAVDVFEDTEGVTFKFDLPEVEAKDVDVGLEDGVLTVRGERKLEREDRREGYHRIERRYGAFARSFTLPPTLEADKATAEQKNGVLRIFVPKRAEAKAEEHQRQGELSPAGHLVRRQPLASARAHLALSGRRWAQSLQPGRAGARLLAPEVELALDATVLPVACRTCR